MFSVSPWVAERAENLFVLNERVAMLGRWRHGFFGMVPVGATNVGSIKINFDQVRPGKYSPPCLPLAHRTHVVFGEPTNTGSTHECPRSSTSTGYIHGSSLLCRVACSERPAPPNFEFGVHAGDKVRVGQKLGDVFGTKEKKD